MSTVPGLSEDRKREILNKLKEEREYRRQLVSEGNSQGFQIEDIPDYPASTLHTENNFNDTGYSQQSKADDQGREKLIDRIMRERQAKKAVQQHSPKQNYSEYPNNDQMSPQR